MATRPAARKSNTSVIAPERPYADNRPIRSRRLLAGVACAGKTGRRLCAEAACHRASSHHPRAPFVDAHRQVAHPGAQARVMVMAAREGYDSVAFVNGRQSAERYDLSKQVDEIHIMREGDTF